MMQDTMTQLSQSQERIMEMLGELRAQETALYNAMKAHKLTTSHPVKRTRKSYVASKTGKSVHTTNCPFGKNIKPKSKVVFATKSKAFNAGYRACDCLKRV